MYCKDCTDDNPDVCNSHLDDEDESYICNCQCHDNYGYDSDGNLISDMTG